MGVGVVGEASSGRRVRIVLHQISPEKFKRRARGSCWTVIEDTARPGLCLWRSWTSHRAEAVLAGAVHQCRFSGYVLAEFVTENGDALDVGGMDLDG